MEESNDAIDDDFDGAEEDEDMEDGSDIDESNPSWLRCLRAPGRRRKSTTGNCKKRR